MFERARIKLTAWYLAIIMAISLLFSFTIYSSINQEFHRFEKVQIRIQEDIAEGKVFSPQNTHFIRFGRPDPEFIEKSRNRLILILALINVLILGLSGIAGYFLAGRTLRPIKKMVDEQKRFITDASHEFRTPLTSLRSEIEVGLRNKKLSIADAQKLLESNLEEVISLQHLSDNLLDLAQNGKLINAQSMSDVSLLKLVNATVKKVSVFAKKKDIKINHKVKDVRFKGVEDRLIEVFVIILDNAIKYSNKKSEIEISSQIVDKHVEVLIKDSGMGIDSKDLPYIFDRFYRADQSRSSISGFGLGLSIAQKIVKAHGGLISVQSEINKGSVFKLSFRLDQ